MAADVSVPNNFVAGTPSVADDVDANFAALVTWVNTNAVHLDASKAFTAVPTGPATDPTTDNQLARKAYVDAAGAKGVVSGGYATATANQTGITTAGADLTSLTITFTAEASRRYRITGHVRVRQQTSPGYVTLRIYDSATQIQAWQAYVVNTATNTAIASVVVTPGAGSKTYKLNLVTNTATVDAESVSTAPSYILVEDVGPA